MTFHVYPDPQTQPLSIGGNQVYPPIGPDLINPLQPPKPISTDASNPNNDQMPPFPPNSDLLVYIRISTSSATKPSVKLKATQNGFETDWVSDGSPGVIYNNIQNIGDATLTVEANGVYLVTVKILKQFSNSPDPYKWGMRIQNNDANQQEFTWVVASTEAESKQPWIDVLPPTKDYDVLVNQSPPPTLTWNVLNRGTGDLNVALDATPNGNPLSLGATLLNISIGSFTLEAVTRPINPNSMAELKIAFRATNIGAISAGSTYALESNDSFAKDTSGHQRKLELKGKASKLEIVLVLDASGSMDAKPNGQPSTVADKSDTRWSKLQTAASSFLDLLEDHGENVGNFAVVTYPGVGPSVGALSSTIQGQAPITNSNVGNAKGTLTNPATKPNDNTPMGAGIELSITEFLDTPDSRNFNRRWMILMTDGYHNKGTHPNAFYATLLTKKIKVITVAYGDPGSSTYTVGTGLLKEIRTNVNGSESEGNLDAGTDDNGLDLGKNFRGTIYKALTLESPADPRGLLTSSTPEARHTTVITPYDTRVSFVVNWGSFNADRVSVQLLTPTCELITPNVTSQNPAILYHDNPRYKIYTITHDYLRNDENPSSPRYGTWTLIVSLSEGDIINLRSETAREFTEAAVAIDSEPYTYEIILQSELGLDVALNQQSYYAGDEIEISASLLRGGQPVTNAVVTLQSNTPGQSADNWLARNNITAQEYANAASQLAGKDVVALGIKSYALALKGITFNPLTSPGSIRMTDTGNGVYVATIASTVAPDTYPLTVTAIITTPEGIAFQREKPVNVKIGVRPDPKFTLMDIQYRREGNLRFADIRVVPRDVFRNLILIDPAVDPSITLTARGGELLGTLSGVNDQHVLDGSYLQSLRYTSDVTPVIGLQVDGQEVFPEGYSLPPIDTGDTQLHFVNQVLDSRLGAGENQHSDPQALLGNPFAKAQDSFFSTGSFGSVTVRVTGEVITATEEGQEVWVFVQPDVELRSYKVEALPFGFSDEWAMLGESEGVTQAFSLASAKLKVVKAIRITDTSGRTRDSDLNVSSTPGVSIRGVGVKSNAIGCLGIFVVWWFSLLQLLSGSNPHSALKRSQE